MSADRNTAMRSIAARRSAVRRAAVSRTRSVTAVRRTRANRVLAVFAAGAGLMLLAGSRVHVNASWSDEAWGYLLVPMGTPRKGDAVIFEPPESLGAEVPYLKNVRGVPGERVDVDTDRGIWIDGVYLGRAKPFALDGRALDAIEPATIPPAHYFLNADHPDSHDSRYAEIGLVPRQRILGRAVAMPDLPWLGLEGPLVEAPCGQQCSRSCERPPCSLQNGGWPISESGVTP